MNKKITDIFKEKYGVDNIPDSINITPKDNLFTTYRKIAKFIYEGVRYDTNYNIDPNEEITAIQAKEQDEAIEPVNFSDANFPSSIKSNLSTFYKFKSDDWTKHIYKAPVIDEWNKRVYKELINDNNKKFELSDGTSKEAETESRPISISNAETGSADTEALIRQTKAQRYSEKAQQRLADNERATREAERIRQNSIFN